MGGVRANSFNNLLLYGPKKIVPLLGLPDLGQFVAGFSSNYGYVYRAEPRSFPGTKSNKGLYKPAQEHYNNRVGQLGYSNICITVNSF